MSVLPQGPTSPASPSTLLRLQSNLTMPRVAPFTPVEVVHLLLCTPPSDPSSPSPPSTSTSLLLLDLRTHTAWTQARVKSSVNVCVPSTLLRRPAFGIERVSEGLSPRDAALLTNWKSYQNVIVLGNEVYNAASVDELLVAGGVRSLLGKFEREVDSNKGANAEVFRGRLGWVQGGFGGLFKAITTTTGSAGAKLLASGPEEEDDDDDDNETGSENGLAGQHAASEADTVVVIPTIDFSSHTPMASTPSLKHARPVLHVRDLPISAFQQASTSAFSHAGLESSPRNFEAVRRPSNPRRRSSKTDSCKRRKGLVLGTLYKHGGPLSSGPGSPLSAKLDGSQVPTPGPTAIDGWIQPVAETRMASNPFFDNIRQNSEALSLSRSLSNLAPVHFPSVAPSLVSRLPTFLSNLIKLDPSERAQVLARQFYELELAERERLEGTLHWHATVQGNLEKESRDDSVNAFAKYAISAGVELGSLNRFKNIFPYDHARVRLNAFSSGATDYINASHLHLATSSKHFIASQGPLRSTFADFWQLCEQEHVGVIIMLTNVIEGGREKCGTYWVTGQNEEWDVRVEGGNEHDESALQEEGGFFSVARTSTVESPAAEETTIRRIVNVRRKGEPEGTKPRKVRHIQYRDWPDFDIPANPADVVALVREVDHAQQEYLEEIGWQGEEEPPCVAHCAGGVGRTGVFLMVSTMMEKLRQDRIARKKERATLRLSRENLGSSTAMAWENTDTPPPLSHYDSSSSTNSTTTSASSNSISTSSSLSPPSSSRPPFSFPPSPLFSSETHSNTHHEQPIVPLPHRKLSDTTSLIATMAGSNLSERCAPNFSLSTTSSLPSLEKEEPLFAAVNEIREQRMSMVANFRQYVCLYECTLIAAVQELEIEGKEMEEEEEEEREARKRGV